jgi:hypothetical protein
LLGTLFWVPVIRHRGLNHRQANHMVALLLFGLLFVSKKSFGGYLIVAAFPVWLCFCQQLAGRKILWLGFCALSTLVACESSLWYRLMRHHDFRGAWGPAAPVGRAAAGFFLAVEVCLLICYAWSLRVCWQAIQADAAPAAQPRSGDLSPSAHP